MGLSETVGGLERGNTGDSTAVSPSSGFPKFGGGRTV